MTTDIKVVSDNKAVYDGYSKGRRGKSGHCDDLWDMVWPLYDIIVDRGSSGVGTTRSSL